LQFLQSKRCFFEKKKQKTFAEMRAMAPATPQPPVIKSFCALFFKKALLSYAVFLCLQPD
jgi:hypothetical protein